MKKRTLKCLRMVAWGIALLFCCAMIVACSPMSEGQDGGPGNDQGQQGCQMGTCPEGQYCSGNGSCKARCQSDKDCAANKQVCLTDNGHCVDCLRNEDCASGESCRRYRCFKNQSCRSSKTCPNNQLCDIASQLCVECLSSNDCDSGSICELSVCVLKPPTCASSKDCKALGRVCDPLRKWCVECLGDNDCKPGSFCQASSCALALCKAGTTRCAKNNVETCKSNGSGWSSAVPCQPTEYCEEGACKPQACTQGTRRCKDGKVQECINGGKEWSEGATCKADEYCGEGDCKPRVCQPNTKRCAGDAVETCKPDGSGYTKKNCEPIEYCKPGGECAKRSCQSNSKGCNGNNVVTCLADGSGWASPGTPCNAGESCEQGACRKQICTPNAVECSDATNQRKCDAKGLNWATQACGSNEYCDKGKCIVGTCPEGKSQTCYRGAPGTQGKGECKAGTQTCTNGAWSACNGEVVPGTEVCNGKDDDCDGQSDEGLSCAPSCIVLNPNPIDLGSTKSGCSVRSVGFTLSNTCTTNTMINKVSIANNTSGAFSFRLNPTTLKLPSAVRASVGVFLLDLGFKPNTVGAFSANLQLDVDPASGSTILIPLRGVGTATSAQTETFAVPKQNKTDLLFVIDNSCSMSNDQSALGSAFGSFLSIVSKTTADYQIGVITTDTRYRGALRGSPKILTPSTPNLASAFSRNVRAGTSGSASERGLETAKMAFSPAALTGTNKGFLRTDARLALIFFSDERDQSPQLVQHYIAFYQSLKAKRGDVKAHALGPYPLRNCQTGTNCRYYPVVKATGGIYEHISTGNKSSFMSKLARAILEAGTTFRLQQTPVVSSIQVKVNGTVVAQNSTNGWVFDAASNSLGFVGTAIPSAGAIVQVNYNASCTP